MPIKDHPSRYELANELHARPFPRIRAPSTAIFLAIKQPEDAARRDRSQDMAHLISLLDRHGVAHPQPNATHYFGQLGKHWLKWEQHTEFVTYTLLTEGASARAFDPADFETFPKDWLENAPGQRITSIQVRIELLPSQEEIATRLNDWFVPESLAVASVLDEAAVVAGDFRIDAAGHQRFALFAAEGTGERRVGRVLQRLCEIETYKSMSMLGFARAKKIGWRMGDLDTRLTKIVGDMAQKSTEDEPTLQALLEISAELETLAAEASFRFGATEAYEAIVYRRIEALREERWKGRQTFLEFMLRRYEPAMRTVRSFSERLDTMCARAARVADLLRTRVDVARSAQNQKLLESMDRRSDLQLRLQRTVEGLSVVAISYYAVSLAGYVLYPLAELTGLSKGALTAIVTLPVVLLVWVLIRRLRRHIS